MLLGLSQSCPHPLNRECGHSSPLRIGMGGTASQKENQSIIEWGAMEATDVNNKYSLQRLCNSLFSYAFYQTSWFYFLLPQSHLRKSLMTSVLVAGWIQTLTILWSPFPSHCSVSPKEGAGSDGRHLAHRPPLSPLGPTADNIHQSQDSFLCRPDVAPETYLKQSSGQPLQMYWCWQVRWNVFAIPGKDCRPMTQTTNAFHSFTKRIHKHTCTRSYTLVFL